MIDQDTLADATADALSLTRQAMLERCGIEVFPWPHYDNAGRTFLFWMVFQDDQERGAFHTEPESWTFAHELAEELIEQGDLT